MKISDDNYLKSFWLVDTTDRGNRKMSADSKQEKKVDQVELSGKLTSKALSESEIRQDKVEEAKEKIAEGVYSDPEVVERIVDRLIDQFGM